MAHVSYQFVASPLARILIASRDGKLVGLWFEQQKYYPDMSKHTDWVEETTPVLQQAAAQLNAYFRGDRQPFDLPLAPAGTPFQQRVWEALQQIPAGSTLTYGGLAKQLGNPRAVRAVAAAVGRNPISVIIPCHRVIGSNGSLTGYAGGVEKKAWMLEREARK